MRASSGIILAWLLALTGAAWGMAAEEQRLGDIPRRLPVPPWEQAPVGVSARSFSSLNTVTAESETPVPEQRELPYRNSCRPVYRSPWLYAGAGLAVGAALAAWWSQERASRAYRRYLHAAGERRQDRALDRAVRYDRVTGACFLTMHAGIGIVTFVLLSGNHG